VPATPRARAPRAHGCAEPGRRRRASGRRFSGRPGSAPPPRRSAGDGRAWRAPRRASRGRIEAEGQHYKRQVARVIRPGPHVAARRASAARSSAAGGLASAAAIPPFLEAGSPDRAGAWRRIRTTPSCPSSTVPASRAAPGQGPHPAPLSRPYPSAPPLRGGVRRAARLQMADAEPGVSIRQPLTAWARGEGPEGLELLGHASISARGRPRALSPTRVSAFKNARARMPASSSATTVSCLARTSGSGQALGEDRFPGRARESIGPRQEAARSRCLRAPSRTTSQPIGFSGRTSSCPPEPASPEIAGRLAEERADAGAEQSCTSRSTASRRLSRGWKVDELVPRHEAPQDQKFCSGGRIGGWAASVRRRQKKGIAPCRAGPSPSSFGGRARKQLDGDDIRGACGHQAVGGMGTGLGIPGRGSASGTCGPGDQQLVFSVCHPCSRASARRSSGSMTSRSARPCRSSPRRARRFGDLDAGEIDLVDPP
jgi:hypothetical protein